MDMKVNCCLLILALFVGNAWGLDANEEAGSAQGQFSSDFLVYSVTWQPTFCIMKPATPGCDKPPQRFLSHGLWPYSKSTREFSYRHPEYCITSPACANDACFMPKDELDKVLANTPLRNLVTQDPAGMFGHEWKKHGTCSGKTMQGYFQDLVDLRKAVTISDEPAFQAMIGKATPFTQIRNAFPPNTAFRCYRDAGGRQYLHEVFYMIDTVGNAYLDEKNLQIGVQCKDVDTLVPEGS